MAKITGICVSFGYIATVLINLNLVNTISCEIILYPVTMYYCNLKSLLVERCLSFLSLVSAVKKYHTFTGLKTAHICYLTALEVGCPTQASWAKIMALEGWFLLEALE